MSLMPVKKCKQEGLAFAAQSSSDQGMAIYEMGWQAEADEVNRARRAAAQRLLEEAGVIPQPTIRRNPLLYLPADRWLRIFSYLDVKTLLHSCALVCNTWLGYVYQMTEKHLSFTGERPCEDCDMPGNPFHMKLESASMDFASPWWTPISELVALGKAREPLVSETQLTSTNSSISMEFGSVVRRYLSGEDLSGMMLYLAKRMGSLEAIGLDFEPIRETDFDKLCQVLAACEKLTSVSVSGENAQYSLTPFWKILPEGLTSLKISDRCLDLDLDCLLQLDKLRELSINNYVMAAICRNPKNISNKILRKLEALTLQYVSYKVLPAPEMLANLTQLSIPAGAESFFKGAIAELVDFVMGLKRLRILSIDSGRDRGESGRPGDLRTLQKHPSLQEIRLISDFAKAGSGTLPESLCSFFAIQHLKVLSLLFRDQVEEPFRGVDFSASGLRQVALRFDTNVPKLKISKLINAPNLELLELEFPSDYDDGYFHFLASLRVSTPRHNKPFMVTVMFSEIPITSPDSFLMSWKSLEQGFGPQDYTSCRRTGLALHQPLLRDCDRKDKGIYCNQAYTAAARARTPRLAAALQSCDFKLFREHWLCEHCKGHREGPWGNLSRESRRAWNEHFDSENSEDE